MSLPAIYTATNGMHEAINQQAENDRWRLRYEYDDVVWFRFEKPIDEDTDLVVKVDVSRKGFIHCRSENFTELSLHLRNMLRAFAFLMVGFWAQYEADKVAHSK